MHGDTCTSDGTIIYSYHAHHRFYRKYGQPASISDLPSTASSGSISDKVCILCLLHKIEPLRITSITNNK
jgi:hypothetical protein